MPGPMAPSEFIALRKMPPEILTAIANAGLPDANGLVGANSNYGWIDVTFQRPAMFTLIVAAMRGDIGLAAKAWDAIDAAFRQQDAYGVFRVGDYQGWTSSANEQLSGTAFWLAELSRALLAVRMSSLGMQSWIDALLPKVAKAYAWLGDRRNMLFAYDAANANRLIYDAQAFGFINLLAPTTLADSDHPRTSALALQSPEGWFSELGGHDASYNGTSLLHLQIYALLFPDVDLAKPIRKAAEWELSRILPSGDVDRTGDTRAHETLLGKPKLTNYSEVGLSLLYYWAHSGDQRYLDAAWRIFKFVKGVQP